MRRDIHAHLALPHLHVREVEDEVDNERRTINSRAFGSAGYHAAGGAAGAEVVFKTGSLQAFEKWDLFHGNLFDTA